MSFDGRGRPLVGHSEPDQFLENAKRHPAFDQILFRPFIEPTPKNDVYEVFDDLCDKKTSGPLSYAFSNPQTRISGAILASAIRFGSLQRIIVEDIILVSNQNMRHAVAKMVDMWLKQKDATIEIELCGIYNDPWKESVLQEFDYKKKKDAVSIFTTNA